MKTPSETWSVESVPSSSDLAVLSDGVIRFGRAEAKGGNARAIACFLRRKGQIVAGASGRTEFDRLFVSYLWVSEAMRGRGLGTQALLRIEAAARARGAKDSLIETLSDRTADLYRRLGYVTVATIPGYVGRFTKRIFVKDLRDPSD